VVEVTVFETTLLTVEVAVVVDVMVVAPPVEVATTVTMLAEPAPFTVVTIVLVTTDGEEVPLCPMKYAMAPTTIATTITAPTKDVVPTPFLWSLTSETDLVEVFRNFFPGLSEREEFTMAAQGGADRL